MSWNVSKWPQNIKVSGLCVVCTSMLLHMSIDWSTYPAAHTPHAYTQAYMRGRVIQYANNQCISMCMFSSHAMEWPCQTHPQMQVVKPKRANDDHLNITPLRMNIETAWNSSDWCSQTCLHTFASMSSSASPDLSLVARSWRWKAHAPLCFCAKPLQKRRNAGWPQLASACGLWSRSKPLSICEKPSWTKLRLQNQTCVHLCSVVKHIQ